jgi:hypothetical protein
VSTLPLSYRPVILALI